MLMISFVIFLTCFLLISILLGFEEDKFIDWVLRNWRLARQQPSPQEEETTEETVFLETVEKFAETASTSDSHVVPVTLLDPDVLECPICCEPFKIPIFQCNNGHLACSPCCEKIENKCPSCKLPIGFSRCRAMERVIEASRMSCPNAKYGCKENTSYQNRTTHGKQCLFAPCSCPVHECYYTGSDNDLYIHVRAKHKDDMTLFIWDINFVIEWDLNKKIAVLQEEEEGKLIVVQVFSRPHGLTVSVSCIGPRVGIFSCTLKFATSTIRLKQALLMSNIQKVRDEHPQDDFVLIPSYMLPSDGNLKMAICISRGLVHLIHA